MELYTKCENKKLAFNSMYLSEFFLVGRATCGKKDFLNRAEMKHRIRILLNLNVNRAICGDGDVDGGYNTTCERLKSIKFKW